MADKKVIGIAENLIRFKTDRESMNRALRDIKKVKEELKSVQGSTQKVKQQTQSATRSAKQRTDQDKDWLTVQRAINKNNKQKIKDEGQLLKHQERKIKLEREHAKVLRQKHIEARKAATAGLTSGAGTSARGTLFADMLRAEDAYNNRRDSILSRRDSQRFILNTLLKLAAILLGVGLLVAFINMQVNQGTCELFRIMLSTAIITVSLTTFFIIVLDKYSIYNKHGFKHYRKK